MAVSSDDALYHNPEQVSSQVDQLADEFGPADIDELGLTIGSTMSAGSFLNWDTIGILALGLLAFGLDTVAGLLFGKLMAALSGGAINPLIGAAGISAFPMAGRLAAKMAQDEDFENFILMHAMGANTAGQLGSVMAGGVLLALVSGLV